MLQRFAGSAAVFRRGRSQAGCTFPSVNSILTSRHPVRFFDGQTDGAEKLIWDLDTGRLRLYDLGTDPGERTDLAEREPDRAERLRRVLAAWLDRHEGPDSAREAVRRAREHEARLRALGYL